MSANPCPVCVYHATNIRPEQLADIECFNCGKPLGTGHSFEARTVVTPGAAYQVNGALPKDSQ